MCAPVDPSVPAGADTGFEDLVRRYGRLIRAVVRKVAGRDAAQLGPDIEQRLLTELWKRHRREEVIEHHASYIYRAAVRETVRAVKRVSRGELALSAELAAPRTDDPYLRLRSKELAEALREEIETLRPDRASAVRFHLAGFPVHEIMARQGWTYQRARNLIARGMADLRERLTRRGIDVG